MRVDGRTAPDMKPVRRDLFPQIVGLDGESGGFLEPLLLTVHSTDEHTKTLTEIVRLRWYKSTDNAYIPLNLTG